MGSAQRGRLRRSSEPAPIQTVETTAAGIYGVIVSAAVMAAAHAPTAAALTVGVLVTLLIYWAAERYSRLVAERIHEGHPPDMRHIRAALTEGWEIVTASTTPLIVLAVLGALGVDLYVAVLSALACSTVLLGLAGWEIGRQGNLRPLERVVSAVAAGSLGVLMIVLKALLH
jgi:hypothetical protein